jgi:uncharacterized protein (TIGR04255 family)
MLVANKVRAKMPFPNVTRVVYAINPLEEVICQLRFPAILKLESEPPVGFQDRVRANYPLYKSGSTVQLGTGVAPNLMELMGRNLSFGAGPPSHEFGSKDASWTLSLTKESLSLVCKKYTHWEEFRTRLSESLGVLFDLYAPSFFVRIGLRYRNIIRRSRVGLNGVDWSELLNPWIAGPYSSPEMTGEVEHSFLQMVLRLQGNDGRVLISSGTVKDTVLNEICYMIDSDFFIDQLTETKDALERLDFLNAQSDRFFRWCIGKRLHDALLVHDDVC